MKKIKLSIIPSQIWKTVLRFPVATFCCVALFVIDLLVINDVCFFSQNGSGFKLNLLLPLGFVLAIALRLFTEDFGWRNWRGYMDILVIPALGLYYCLLPGKSDFSYIHLVYYITFWLVALIALCMAPYRSLARPSLFWQYNVKIWWGILFSGLCALVFLGGFCLALFAVGALFDLDIPDKWYMYLVIFWGIVFAPLFFAAGIPAQSQFGEEQKMNYTVLRVFGQYVLLPILVLYLLIFYAYELKIIINWQLPEGWVGWLTLVYSAAGLFIYFLLHYLYITKATKIATLFGRYFFYSELPVIALMFVAVYRRTADYGITENRYFLWLSALWLLGISLYMIFIKGKTFRPVLVSLACVALLSVVGPWNAFNVSKYSQIRRLEKLLAKQEWLKEGIIPNATQIDQMQEDFWQMSDIKRYFEKRGKSLPPGIDSLYNVCKELYYNNHAKSYNNAAAVEETAYFEIKTEDRFMKIAGYDWICYYSYEGDSDERALSAKDSTLACKVKERAGDRIEIYRYGTLLTAFSLPDAVRQIAGVDWTDPAYYTVADRQTIPVNARYAVVFTDIDGIITINSGKLNIYRAKMYILGKK